MIASKKEKFKPIIDKMKGEIESFIKKNPHVAIHVANAYDFDYSRYLGEEMIIKCIKALQVNAKYENPFFKSVVTSVISPTTLKMWVGFLKNNHGIGPSKINCKKVVENLLILEKFNQYQIQFCFALIGILPSENNNYAGILRRIFNNYYFLEEVIKTELFHLKFIRFLCDIQKQNDPSLFFMNNSIFWKIESLGIKSLDLLIGLREALEHYMSSSTEKTKVSKEIQTSVILYLLRNGVIAKEILFHVIKNQNLGNFCDFY